MSSATLLTRISMTGVCVALTLASYTSAPAHAQTVIAPAARGIHTYTTQPIYEGEPGPPWESRMEIRDTTITGRKAISVTHRAHLMDNAWMINDVAVWVPGDSSVIGGVWSGEGREPGTCAVEMNGSKGRLSINHGMTTESSIGANAVPEFALANMIASRPLADGATVHYDAFRCSWSGYAPEPLTLFNFTGVVSSGTMARGDKPAEPVWIVTGNSTYPFVAWIAKSDREVLKATLPQGTSGSMTETFVRLALSK